MFFILLIPILLSSCKQEVDYEVTDPLYKSEKGILQKERIKYANNSFRAEMNVKLLKRYTTEAMGIQVNAFGAFNVYWDGVLLGSNGQQAQTGKAEIPGTETTYYAIPEQLAGLGDHVILLVGTQAFFPGVQRGIDVKPEGYQRLLRVPLIIMSFMNLMAGAFLIAAIYYFLLYWNSRSRALPVLLFGGICLLFFSLLIVEYLKFYTTIPYTWFYFRLEVIGWLTFTIALLVPWYFMLQFQMNKKVAWLLLLLATLTAVYIVNYRHYDITAIRLSHAMWAASMLITAVSVFRKMPGAVIVLAGLLLSAVVNYFLVYDFGLFIAFTIIVLCMLYLHTIRSKQIEDAHHAALLRSSRLQLELVKKNIQPHFLRNTLTSLIDWVEEDPQQGVIFIRSLADEFDILNAISEVKLIPIRQEIDLCRKHLEVMSFRKEICYTWEEHGVDENDLIPPATLHTLIENGITHSLPPEHGCITFRLSVLRKEDHKEFQLLTIAKNREPGQTRGGGTGFQYIRARLSESYGENWLFDSHAVEDGWLSSIKITQQT
ncbi:histidine kinase [Mucilaginibacter sp.]|uniref:histidine kinase n=1 Tax=Mucilaginibacter sp. TaxID=1882438 RepID=UPI003264A1A9